MIDKDLVASKAGSVQKHLQRVILKRNVDLASFLSDIDRQESIFFNLQMAIQNCIDIAAHFVSAKGLGVPGSTNEMFYLLEENGFIDKPLAEKMVLAVGFRNLIVHEYGRTDLTRVYKIIHDDIENLKDFVRAMIEHSGL